MIYFHQVNKYYGDFHVLKDINLTINQGKSSSSSGHPDRARARLCVASTGLRRFQAAN
ncbi:Glutamine transport ATP-binding protein GlnQ [Geobacillus sp. BCO2]|nr:Glutamine transport ATP-binding protein GlnQ [Geobacillus sp. BCO2]